MKKHLSFLLSSTLLLNASLAIAQTTTITVTGYPAPPSSTANYYSSMVGPSGAELQQQQAAIAARVAYEKQKACAQVAADIKAIESNCSFAAAETQYDSIDDCPSAVTVTIGYIVGLEVGLRETCVSKAEAQFILDDKRCTATANAKLAALAKQCS